MMVLKLSDERFDIIKRFIRLSCGHRSPEISSGIVIAGKIEVIVYFYTGRAVLNETFNTESINKLIKTLDTLKLNYTHERKTSPYISNYSVISFYIDFELIDKIGKLI